MERRIKVNINKGKYPPPIIIPRLLRNTLVQSSARNVFSGNGRMVFFISSFYILLFFLKRELDNFSSIHQEISYHMLPHVAPAAQVCGLHLAKCRSGSKVQLRGDLVNVYFLKSDADQLGWLYTSEQAWATRNCAYLVLGTESITPESATGPSITMMYIPKNSLYEALKYRLSSALGVISILIRKSGKTH